MHPAIRIARVRPSQEFFLAPQSGADPTAQLPRRRRDLLRQAAHFRVFRICLPASRSVVPPRGLQGRSALPSVQRRCAAAYGGPFRARGPDTGRHRPAGQLGLPLSARSARHAPRHTSADPRTLRPSRTQRARRRAPPAASDYALPSRNGGQDRGGPPRGRGRRPAQPSARAQLPSDALGGARPAAQPRRWASGH
jgi:hypothetical protein